MAKAMRPKSWPQYQPELRRDAGFSALKILVLGPKKTSLRARVAFKEGERKTTTQEVVIVEVNGRSKTTFPSGVEEQLVSEQDGRPKWNQDFSDFVKGFVLPKGYPASVTDDYLLYQLRTLPAHVTGWLSKSLATSSLIHALGVGSVGPTGTVAASAAIKWITKDGLGAFGRFLVGGRLGGVFDEDPRRWRMIAVGFATLGLALEIATTAYPAAFIPLASAGNFTKAVGRGLSQPCFRIIQNHFALANNVGDISAKEEVWEVSAQLLGLGTSVVLLRAIESGGKPEAVLWIWVLVQIVHVGLRYWSLDSLRFAELNQKRACILASSHVQGRGVPSVRDANAREPMLASSSGVAPHVHVGASLREAFGGAPSRADIEMFAGLFGHERFWLVWRRGRGRAVLTNDFGPRDMLRLLWQAAWLDARGISDASPDDLADSLAALEEGFPGFEREMEERGWRAQKSAYRLGDVRIQKQ